MSKYIDVDKLIAEIERISAEHSSRYGMDEAAIVLDKLEDFISSLQQEQPEVDLEKFAEKIKTYHARYKHPESTSIKAAMAFMARMFYQYPNVARMWYEELPKATMD